MSTLSASAEHRLDQVIANWFEQYFALPLLTAVADRLELFPDSRFIRHTCRSNSIAWTDLDGHQSAFNFVLELGGTEHSQGVPVAFVESFCTRGVQQSRDSARKGSLKLHPMREAFPTARFLGVIASGNFAGPPRKTLASPTIDMLYIPKPKVLAAFAQANLVIDYPDTASEAEKERIARALEGAFNQEVKQFVAASLRSLVGPVPLEEYTTRVRSRLSALPQEIRLSLRHESAPYVFHSIEEVSDFLVAPQFKMDLQRESYNYDVTFSDGSEFSRNLGSIEQLRQLNRQVESLAAHMSRISLKLTHRPQSGP